MGLDYLDLRMLWEQCARAEPGLRHVVAIGRQRLFLHPSEIDKLKKEVGRDVLRGYVWDDYFESYLARMFDCRSIASIDASSFEGAEIIHDMNRPVSTELESKFDLVVDGGSLEHIFNFPVAVSNLMRMAVVGGFVMTSNPANNLCGHGFYQLSPELMYRSFSAKNGFRIQELLLVEHAFPSTELRRHGRAVRVRDPAVVGERVIALSGVPLVMKTVARKVEEAAVFADPPQQSDYAVAWKDTEHHGHRARLPRGILRAALDNLPQPIRLLASGYRQRARYRISNRRFFEPYL